MNSQKYVKQTDFFKTMLEAWLLRTRKIINKEQTITASDGKKYVKIRLYEPGCYVEDFCYIDKANGNVLKPQGWGGVAPGVRGNIFAGWDGVDKNGAIKFNKTYD